MSNHLVPLSALPGPTLRLACRYCPRVVEHRLSEAIAFHGPDEPVHDVIQAEAADCPRFGSREVYRQCGLRMEG